MVYIKDKKIEIKNFFNNNGYLIFNINDNKLIDKVVKDVKNIIKNKKYKTNSEIYSYNDSPRIVESFKYSQNCKLLAVHKIIKNTIKIIYGEKPLAFSTINFIKSTQQPLHSDYVHFATIPELKLVGSWVALEDIHPDSGPLQVVPRSHKLKIFNYQKDIDYSEPTNLENIKKNYKRYEKWVLKLIKKKNLKPMTPKMKKGDCIIWDANMLHGSPVCKNNKLSRMSQVTHWAFKSVVKHYNPVFSNLKKNLLVERKVNYII
jgi:ectoine hydroxylase-related dioxygenase (phytanoyl-CoA dioxygenase family)